MKKTIIILLTSLAVNFNLNAQDEDGYWDSERATEKKIPLSDGNRTWVRVNIPAGTTQLIYRVSFLDENGEIRNSLASTLSNVPSASAQGVSAALSLLNTIGGDNKGTFYIFTNDEGANNYFKNGILSKPCYRSSQGIPAEKGFLKLEENGCLTSNTDYLYFAFYNGNDIDDMKIVLEVMPWVDNIASRGWTKEIKEKFVKGCMSDYKELTQPEEVCQCILDKLQGAYKIQDFQQMAESEINKITSDFTKECISETGEDENQLNIDRDNADDLAEKGQYGEAIGKLLPIVESGKANGIDYNNIGYYYIMTKQYLRSIKYLKEGEKLDETELLIKGNLAHAYLFNGDIDQAKTIYLKYKTQNIDEKTSWVDMVKSDFELFKKQGLPADNFETILATLK